MVNQRDTERGRQSRECVGHLHISIAGKRATGRMIVRQQHCPGIENQRPAKDVPIAKREHVSAAEGNLIIRDIDATMISEDREKRLGGARANSQLKIAAQLEIVHANGRTPQRAAGQFVAHIARCVNNCPEPRERCIEFVAAGLEYCFQAAEGLQNHICGALSFARTIRRDQVRQDGSVPRRLTRR